MKRIAALLVLLAVWLITPGAQRQAEPPSVPEEVLVKFRPESSEARRRLALARRNARALRHFGALDIHHVGLPRGQNLEAALAELRIDPDVLYAQPNYIRRTTSTGVPNDPLWLSNSLWGMHKIKAPDVWANYGTGSSTIVIGSIDTGVNYSHSDLAANMWTNPGEVAGNGIDDDNNGYVDDVHGINALTHSGNPMDDHGHGTHTAGTMAGVGNNGVGVVGVNWNARILACKFLSASGIGTDAGAIECFNYLTQQKQRGVNIRVSNSSWGATREGGVPTALKAAIDAAGAAGILNICAAGNSGSNNVTAPYDPASLTSASIIAVAASSTDDSRAGFSNYGTNVHLAAPGAWIVSTYGFNYGELSGTSMAAPHVAGAAALVASLSPSSPPLAIKDLLISNVDVRPEWSGLVSSGGRLNVLNAVQSLVGGLPPESQTLLTTQVPDGEFRDGGGITYELGLKLRSDVAGQITALRYWKASLENGPHIGRVWTAAGQLLATVTFTNETAVGWQQQALATPIAIAAQADYVVTVSTGANGYYVSAVLPGATFAVIVTNGHLTTSGVNAGRYGPLGSAAPNPSEGNYFRDIVFVPDTGPADTTPPTVAITAPGSGSTVGGTVTLSATASDNIGVAGVQFQVDGANVGSEIATAPYSVSWNSGAVTNGPHTVTAIARDGAGNTTPASIGVTVSNGGTPPPGQQTLLTTQVPDGEFRDGGGITYELGLKLRSDVAGQITALRYWKASLENGPHIGRVWTAAGQLLATVTFTNETAVGWQQQALATPIAIAAQADYVVTVSTGANGYYVSAVLPGATFAVIVTNGHLTTSGVNAGRYGPLGSAAPNPSEGNYFRDIVFVPDTGPADTTPPTVAITAPGSGSTVGGTVTLSATASDNIGVAGVQFQVDGANVGSEIATAPYSVSWNSGAVTNGPHTVTAIARDGAGNTTPASIGVTVSNGGTSPPGQQTLLTTQVPDGEFRDGGGITYELGLKLRSDVAGQITALRYWKASLENGPHIGRVWTAAGQLLATVTFTNETAVGWQQQALATPIAIAAQADYVVTVSTGANGYYVSAVLPGATFAVIVTNGHLTTSGVNAGRYGPLGSAAPNPSEGNYFRDIVFVPDTGPADTTPAPVSPSNLNVRLDLVGQIPTFTNPTSPTVAGSQLLLPDQAGYIYRWDGSQLHTLLTPGMFPPGIFPPGRESVLNVAANQTGSLVYVMYSTFVEPVGIPVSASPRPSDSWQVLYESHIQRHGPDNSPAPPGLPGPQ